MDIVARRIPGRFGMDPCRDVQVLAPKRRYGGRVFRVGDKVRNYGITTTGVAGVFNGTVGVVTGMSVEDGKLTVLTDEDESIGYAFDELDELAHAYAVTIHRSRGSEYPAVVVPLTPGSWMMLQRNLLYTAITRAKRLVVLVGSRRALAAAVRTPGTGRRHTGLTHRLDAARLSSTAFTS
jgi:exodeoxyribonuclease V alpha subunit